MELRLENLPPSLHGEREVLTRCLDAFDRVTPIRSVYLAEVLEKILKAELIRLGWVLEKSHDLEKLANELNARGSDLVQEVRPLAIALAEVYFADRYPGFDLEDPDWPAFRQKLAQVDAVLQKVKKRVAPKRN